MNLINISWKLKLFYCTIIHGYWYKSFRNWIIGTYHICSHTFVLKIEFIKFKTKSISSTNTHTKNKNDFYFNEKPHTHLGNHNY